MTSELTQARFRRERMFSSMLDSMSDLAFMFDCGGRVLFANQPLLTLWGVSMEAALGKSLAELGYPPELDERLREEMQQVIETRVSIKGETAFQGATGSVGQFEYIFSPLLADDGAVEGVVGTSRDVSERKRSELELWRRKKRLRDLIDGLGPSMFVALLTPDGVVLEVNQPPLVAAGLKIEDVLGKRFEDTYWWAHSSDARRQLREAIQRATHGEPSRYDVHAQGIDGQLIDIDFSLQPLLDESGKVAFLVPSAAVITERRVAEAATRISEERYRTLIAATTAIVWTTAASGQFEHDQPSWDTFTGQSSASSHGWGWMTAIHPDDQELTRLRWQHALDERSEYHTEQRVRRADGEYRHMSVRAVPILEPDGTVREWVGVHTDVTEQRRAEEKLRASEAAYHSLADAMPQIVWSTRPDGSYELHNRRWYEYTGLTPEESQGQPWERAFHPLDQPLARERWLLSLATGEPYEIEFRCRRHDGEYRWFLGRALAQRDERGAVTRWLGTWTDIHEFKNTQAERAVLLAQLALQIERMPLAYLLSGPDFRYTRWNPAAERAFGFTAAEVVGKHPAECIIPPQSMPVATAIFDRLKAGDMHANCTSENITKDGRTITCEWYNTPLFSPDGAFQGVLSLAQDVSARILLEQQFRQSQKMDAFGQLAGGVAHDFNNLLTVINGCSELLVESLPAGTPAREMATSIQRAGERSAGLTRQLLAFSRQQILAPRTLDINEVVGGTDKMLRRVLGEDILLTSTLASSLWTVRSDPGQVEQVLLNLVVNARDAMPRGGRLTIETRNVSLSAEYARANTSARSGPHVVLSVTDTGCGMTPAVRARIFEPFFTTKEQGKGTGIGLATVYGIVAQSGGHVTVYSEVGVGTTFKVYLPREEQTAEAPAPSAKPRPPQRGTETILLVEDEEEVREFTRILLKRFGYTVLEARDGSAALELAAGYKGIIHLLLTDVVMPGRGGRSLAEDVAKLHPESLVMFMSGYTDDAVIRHGVLVEGMNFIQKPFSPHELASKIRAVLDAAPRSAAE